MLNGRDIVCQAKSGMGKTAVFVLSILHMLKPEANTCQALVLTHTRELAQQIFLEFERFAQGLPVKVDYYLGGESIEPQKKRLAKEVANIVVGSPGRILQLIECKALKMDKVEFFVLDECDKMLQATDMRAQVQAAFKQTPHDKQVMMFSATLPEEIRPICRKITKNPMEIYVDDHSKLTLHGLLQHYISLPEEKNKNRQLFDLLDQVDFNQVIIFVSMHKRAETLAAVCNQGGFPTTFIHGGLKQPERMKRFEEFKNYGKRILVATDVMGRGIDVNRVNLVINYDLPPVDRYDETDETAKSAAFDRAVDQYLHRVGRAGRVGTKGLAITFMCSEQDAILLNKVQERFSVNITELKDVGKLDASSYKDEGRDKAE